jgi:hypothetical protein
MERYPDALRVDSKEPYEIADQIATQNAGNATGPDSIDPQKDGSSEEERWLVKISPWKIPWRHYAASTIAGKMPDVHEVE